MIKTRLKVLRVTDTTIVSGCSPSDTVWNLLTDEGNPSPEGTEIIVIPVDEQVDGVTVLFELSILPNFGFTVVPRTAEFKEGDIIELTLNNTTPHEPEQVELNPTERTNENGNE